jgi:hypothetical protein
MEFMRVLPCQSPITWTSGSRTRSIRLLGSLGCAAPWQAALAGNSPALPYGVQGRFQAVRGSRFVRGGMVASPKRLPDRSQHGAGLHRLPGRPGCVDAGYATGVLLENGEDRCPGGCFECQSAPYFPGLVGPEQPEVRFVQEVRHIRYRGSLALLIWPWMPCRTSGRLHSASAGQEVPC